MLLLPSTPRKSFALVFVVNFAFLCYSQQVDENDEGNDTSNVTTGEDDSDL
jgi:hypothetical protein